MLRNTWWTPSTAEFAYGFLIVVGVGLILKSFNRGRKSFLNSEPLSNITLFGRGYLDNHTSSKKLLIFDEDLLIVGTSATSNHPVAGSRNVITVNSRSTFFGLSNPGCCWYTYLVYGPIRSTWTVSHGISAPTSLGGTSPYLTFLFLFFWQILHFLQYCSHWYCNPDQW